MRGNVKAGEGNVGGRDGSYTAGNARLTDDLDPELPFTMGWSGRQSITWCQWPGGLHRPLIYLQPEALADVD
jgi:hypothetical protein